MSSFKRLEKYRNELDNHVENVNRKLDEEIQRMRNNIKTAKEKSSEKQNQKKELLNRIDIFEKKMEVHNQIVVNSKDSEKVNDVKLIEDIGELQTNLKFYMKKNSEIKNQTMTVINSINYMKHEARKETVLQEIKNFKNLLDNTKKEVQDLRIRKKAQDSGIERLKEDAKIAENSKNMLENTLQNEIRRRVEQNSETIELSEQAKIYEEENIHIEDEFNKLLKTLKETGMRVCRLENDAEEKRKRLEKVIRVNDEYLNAIRLNIEKIYKTIEFEENVMKADEEITSAISKDVNELEEEYKLVKEKKCISKEIVSSDDSDSNSFEDVLEDISKNHEKILHDLFERKKNINSSLTVKESSGRNNEKNSNIISKLKKSFINIKRGQKALEFKKQALQEKKQLLLCKMENFQKEEEQQMETLRRIESFKEAIAQEILTLDSTIIDLPTGVKDKSESERKVELLRELVRKQISQNDHLYQRSMSLKKDLSSLTTKIRMLGNHNVEEYEKQREEEKIIVRRIRTAYGFLTKKAKQMERELEFCIIQRESTVNRAQSVVYLDTTVKTLRNNEIEDIKERIKEKKELLENQTK